MLACTSRLAPRSMVQLHLTIKEHRLRVAADSLLYLACCKYFGRCECIIIIKHYSLLQSIHSTAICWSASCYPPAHPNNENSMWTVKNWRACLRGSEHEIRGMYFRHARRLISSSAARQEVTRTETTSMSCQLLLCTSARNLVTLRNLTTLAKGI